MAKQKEHSFLDTKTFEKARKLTDRTEIARAFNLEGRIALKMTLNADEYGDKGNRVKMAYSHSDGEIAYEELTVRRFYDDDKIILFGECGYGIKDSFSFSDVKDMFEKQNLVTVKDGDKCVVLVEVTEVGGGFVMTGTIRLPRKSFSTITEGYIELD